MSLSLACTCGARFEVEETLAGQEVACPDCHALVHVPARSGSPTRTSGWAVASVLSALVLAFTGIGTILAVLFGLIALVSIARNRGRLAGTGFAVFGIITGILFTGLFAFAVSRVELFDVADQLRARFNSDQVDRSGPMEVLDPGRRFAITRPSRQWGVARGDLAMELLPDGDGGLALGDVRNGTYLTVVAEDPFGQTLDEYRRNFMENLRRPNADLFQFDPDLPRLSDCQIRQSRTLPRTKDMEAYEILYDQRVDGQPFTYLVRLVQPLGQDDEIYILQGWTTRYRFHRMEGEVRKALDSFRFLK